MAKTSRKASKPKNLSVINRDALEFRFSRNSNIGTADASDDKFLTDAFYDNGTLEVALDTSSAESIIVGRTGSGKTALIKRIIETEDRVININPENLALGYLVDSSLLRFFYDQGVKMDVFYRLLWSHIFISEILKARFNITNEMSKSGMLSKLSDFFSGNRGRTDAVNYLLEWGDKFWLDTEFRVKEVITTLEKQISEGVSAEARAAIPDLIDLKASADHKNAKSVKEEIKSELIKRGIEVVSKIQSKKIHDLVELLETEILSDRQKSYYITIDKLDENWINDELRYQIIKSLIEVARDLNSRIHSLKIIIAIRYDLITRVFLHTHDSGFQEEKFHSLYLDLIWQPKELEKLLEYRARELINQRSLARHIALKDIISRSVNGKSTIDYLIVRTMLRPRDLIVFFNNCIKQASGKSVISASDIIRAELDYSESRIYALAAEWGVDYPDLESLILFMKKFPAIFQFSDVKSELQTVTLDYLTDKNTRQCSTFDLIKTLYSDRDIMPLYKQMMQIFYNVGVVGVRNESHFGTLWSFKKNTRTIPNITERSSIYVHPSLWSYLGITPVDQNMSIIN